jgi:protein phosphatase methylesterase 1
VIVSAGLVAHCSAFHQPLQHLLHLLQSAETLVQDVVELLHKLLSPGGLLAQQNSDDVVPRSILLVGHSLGGAIAIRLAALYSCTTETVTATVPVHVKGVVCIDVAEGTAMASLPHMAAVIAAMPQTFSSTEAAVMWHVKTGAIRSYEAAQITVPSRLIATGVVTTAATTSSTAAAASSSAFETEYRELEQQQQQQQLQQHEEVRWRTDLLSSERYWSGWFTGLSSLFLSLKMPKVRDVCFQTS